MADPASTAPAVYDGYAEAAAAKLWALLPAVYRALDSDTLDAPGPLRELLDRVAEQVAVVRRSIDRLWADQSIESCDDWVIPYIGALLDTNLVPSMDPRGQRLDVANTINYRRRKGTLGLVEELAADVTGWESRAVEMFRRLGRRRHGIDPELGSPADSADPAGQRLLQLAERLVGPLTGTPAGGRADLRSVPGAQAAGGPFDEYARRLDVRRGRGALGWYGIPKVGLFLWRSASIQVERASPVPVAGCPGHYAVDPTGRQIALWQVDARPPQGYGENWAPLDPWQVPGPLSQAVWDAVRAAHATPPGPGAWPDSGASLWPGSVAVRPLGTGVPLAEDTVALWPEVGRFAVPAATGAVETSYAYGLADRIGAGPYDRRLAGAEPAADPSPVVRVSGGTDVALHDALAALTGTGSVVITDGLTSTAVAALGSPAVPVVDAVVRAVDEGRAVLRLTPDADPWVVYGSPPGQPPTARLRLEGILLSGQDLVLRGGFAEVVLSCCTVDPGTEGDLRQLPTVWAVSVDGRDLLASRIWVEGTVRRLVVDRCILGPIRVRLGGIVEELCAADTVLQGLPGSAGDIPSVASIQDSAGLGKGSPMGFDAAALWLLDGVVWLSRCTVLGRAYVHRLECSESILDDVTFVADTQHGCVRFSAWSQGSSLPRQYESVQVSAGAPFFVSRRFGEAGFAQLSEGADAAVLSATTAGDATIRAGSHDGAEMGAFCRAGAAVKQRCLLIKLQEYLPVGLTPVLIPMPPPDAEGETRRGRPWPPT